MTNTTTVTRSTITLLILLGLASVAVPHAAAAGVPVPGHQTQDTPAVPEAERIDLNTATARDLETLPGVGERTAELILAYREEQGGFQKVEELMNIRGIGEKTFLRLRPLVRIGEAPATDR